MTTGKHVQIEWTEEEKLVVVDSRELLQNVENGVSVTKDDINGCLEWIEYLIEPLQDRDPLIDRLKLSQLEQLKECLKNSKIKLRPLDN